MKEQDARERFISKNLDAVPASGIRKFFDILMTVDDVISLSIGEPDYVTPSPIREAAIKSITQGKTHYTSNYGILELREKLSNHLKQRYDVMYDPETELIITAGSSEAFDLALRALLDQGDEVICPDPYYVAYPPAVALAGGTFKPIQTTAENNFQLLVNDVTPKLSNRTKALLFGYPANPTGATMDRKGLLEIAKLAEKHDLAVISDELYDRLTYEGSHTCFASLPGMQERTILIGGFSKAYAMTGWRVGWVAAPANLIEAMMKIHQYVMLSAPTVAQYAGIAALEHGDTFVDEMVAEYDKRRRLIIDGFRAIGLETFESKGSFYVFPKITLTGMSSEEFSSRLLEEERVAVVPGNVFGEAGEGHVRACYAGGNEEIERALERIGRFVQRNH